MRKGRRNVSRVLFAGLLAVLMVVSMFAPSIGSRVSADGVVDLSLYERASELTREFATALAPGSDAKRLWMLEGSTSDEWLAAGNAGGLLGYADVLADDQGIIGWLMNSYTGTSGTITYDQLQHIVKDGDRNPFYQYAGYGEALTDMGLVATVRPGLGEMGRIVATGLILLVYLLANAAPFLFKGALLILTTLNPFRMFETVFSGIAAAELGILSGVAEYVGELYETVQSFSMVVILPILIVSTAAMILMFRTTSVMKGMSRYALRVFMIFAGLPLIGSTYTGVLKDMDSQVAVGSEYADYLVLSSYVDFESWVKYSRLAPPVESKIRNPRYQTSDGAKEKRSISDRKLILEINGGRAANPRAQALKERYGATSDMSQIFQTGGAQQQVTNGGKMSDEAMKSFSNVYSVLTRHMSSARYTSSDYDGEVSGQIQKLRRTANSDDVDKSIVKMFSLSASDSRTFGQKYNPLNWEAEDWMKGIKWNGKDNATGEDSAKGLFTADAAKYDLFRFGPYTYNIYNAGDLRYELGTGYITNHMDGVVSQKTQPIGGSRETTVGGLSPLAMYNFLNTTFTDTGLIVYSPMKTASDLSRDSYAAVSFGGSGMSAFTRWVENFVVMLSLALLSISYGIMMISVAIKSIPRIVSGIFGTALGSISYITKLLISTSVLIIQVLGMIFFYALSENIVMTMLLNFNDFVSVGGEYFGSGLIFEFLGSFMVTILTAAVTWFMIRNVAVFKNMLEEVVSTSINRLMSTLDTSTGGKGLDMAKTTGGRVSDSGLTEKGHEQNKGLLGGVAGILGDAHAIEAKREQIAQENNQDTGGMMAMLKSRASTAKDLAGARSKDVGKAMVGIDGKSYEREKEAKDRKANSMFYNKDSKDDFAQARGTFNKDAADMSTAGQRVDANGEVVKDEHGDAIDAYGNPISSAVPLSTVGANAMVADDNSLMDVDGNVYTDEAGNAFYQDEKGNLVNAQGEHVALDTDGVLQPVNEIENGDGKPVSAAEEARKLDEMRFDADKYKTMRERQDATHYGMDANGQAVGKDGDALKVRTSDGFENVTFDKDGYLVDSSGNRVAASQVLGAVDSRGFEKVKDAKTGETHLKHRGDEAMKRVLATSNEQQNGAKAAYYGKDAKGQVVGRNGEPLQVNTATGRQNARVDSDGYVVDKAGNRVSAEQMVGKVDSRGFEKVKDSATGVTHLRHRGDKALKPLEAAYYGTDSAGQVIGRNGDVLSVQTATGQESAVLNSDGYVVDSHGNKATVSQMSGKVDSRGFEQVKDTATGATYLRHRGEDARVPVTQGAEQQVAPNLTALAKQSNRADKVAQRATARVEQLKSNGASSYVVLQAQRHAQSSMEQARQAQDTFNQAMTQTTGSQAQTAQQPVTQEHVASVARNVKAEQSALRTEAAKLTQMKEDGTPARAVARQQRKVEAQRQSVRDAVAVEDTVRVASKSGRSYNEVHQAKERETRSERLFVQAQTAHAEAVAAGKPADVIAKHEQRLTKASNTLSDARRNMERVSQPPMGSRSQLDKATARHEQAQTALQRASVQVARLENKPNVKPQDIQVAKQAQAKAQRNVVRAYNAKQSLLNPDGWSTDKGSVKVQAVPKVNSKESYATLAMTGITNYRDYRSEVTKHSTELKEKQVKLHQTQQLLDSYKASNRPASVIDKAQTQVNTLQKEVNTSQTTLTALKNHAHGLLKNGSFKPVVATKPLRKAGSYYINDLVSLGHTQDVYDKLSRQAKQGVITAEGRQEMKALNGRLNRMRKDLVQAGLREDSLRDSKMIGETMTHMVQSWDAFVEGKSTEHSDS